jgi:hypothetical protein
MTLFSTPDWIDFDRIREAAKANALAICRRILPGGFVRGREYVARNPLRHDKRPGSFSVNLRTGKWADFATDDRGNDLIGLVAWRFGIDRIEAAKGLAVMLGISERNSK